MACRLFIRVMTPKTIFATAPATKVASTCDSGENSGISVDTDDGAYNLFCMKLQTTFTATEAVKAVLACGGFTRRSLTVGRAATNALLSRQQAILPLVIDFFSMNFHALKAR